MTASIALGSGWAPQNCLPSNTKALNRDKTTSDQGVRWGRAAIAHSEGSRGTASGIGYWLSPVCLCLPPQTMPLLETLQVEGPICLREAFGEKRMKERYFTWKRRGKGKVDV